MEQSSQPCRQLLASYIERLRKIDLPWYERSSSRQYWLWQGLTLLTFVAALGTSVLAALAKQEWFNFPAQVVLVMLPLIGAAAGQLLTQFQFRQLEDLRERGRIEMEDIVRNAEKLLAAAQDEAAYQLAYEDTRARVKALDMEQHREHTNLHSGGRSRSRAQR